MKWGGKEVQKTGQGLLHAKICSYARDMAKYEREAAQAIFLAWAPCNFPVRWPYAHGQCHLGHARSTTPSQRHSLPC